MRSGGSSHVLDILDFYDVDATVGESDSDDITVTEPDYDKADWNWNAPGGDVDEDPIDEQDVKQVAAWTMEECRKQGMSARETAEFVPYSHATVSNWWKEIDEGGEKRDWVDTVEQVIA